MGSISLAQVMVLHSESVLAVWRCAVAHVVSTRLARHHMASVKWVLLQLLSWKCFTLWAATAS
jgi:hypothetical protein